MHLIRLRVGPFEFREPGGMNRRLQWNGAFTGIVYLRAGRRAMKATALRQAMMLLAGPFSNLASALFAIRIFERLAIRTNAVGEFVALSLCVTVGNLLPWRSKGLKTDGYQLCTLICSKQGREKAVLSITLAERGKQLKELYAAGSLEEVDRSLGTLIRTFDILPELPNAAEVKAKLCLWRVAVEKAIVSRTESAPKADAMMPPLTDLETPSAVS